MQRAACMRRRCVLLTRPRARAARRQRPQRARAAADGAGACAARAASPHGGARATDAHAAASLAQADAPTPAAFTRGGTSPDASLLLVQARAGPAAASELRKSAWDPPDASLAPQRTLSAYFQRNRADECAVEELQRALAAAAAAKGLPPPPRAQLDTLLQSLSDANRILLSQDGATVYLL